MRDSLIKEIGELVSTENAYEDELKKFAELNMEREAG